MDWVSSMTLALSLIQSTIARDDYVNDNRREITGIDAIRRWVEKEIVGDKVTLDVREVNHHDGETIIRAAYDGEFDKTNLRGELINQLLQSGTERSSASLSFSINYPPPEQSCFQDRALNRTAVPAMP